MDKTAIYFLGHFLYIKEIINSAELDAILDCRNEKDLDNVVDKMLRGDYLAQLKKGESYNYY